MIGDRIKARINELKEAKFRKKPYLGILNSGKEDMSMLVNGVEVYYVITYTRYRKLTEAINILKSTEPPYNYAVVDDDSQYPRSTQYHLFIEDAFKGSLPT